MYSLTSFLYYVFLLVQQIAAAGSVVSDLLFKARTDGDISIKY